MLRDVGIELELLLMSYPEEQLDTIEEVAERSTLYLRGTLKTDFFIDDSGLFIKTLNGFPGVYSSYVFRTLGNVGILDLMKGKTERSAEFRTCIAYFDDKLNLFTGRTQGLIATDPRGTNGFGFDPVFIPDERKETYAEMTTEEKNSISHRSKATQAFLKYIKKKTI
jgi:XTP/dITP diphosphohydrolase